jgi:hypothetical protein
MIALLLALAFSPTQPNSSWVCSAVGIDLNRQTQEVGGHPRDTEELARESANRECSVRGYLSCSVKSCIEVPRAAPAL